MTELLQKKAEPWVTPWVRVMTILSVCGFLLILDMMLVIYNPSYTYMHYLGAISVATYAGWYLNKAVSMTRTRRFRSQSSQMNTMGLGDQLLHLPLARVAEGATEPGGQRD